MLGQKKCLSFQASFLAEEDGQETKVPSGESCEVKPPEPGGGERKVLGPEREMARYLFCTE